MSKQNEWGHLLISLTILLVLIGLGVYGNVYDKLDVYEQQVSQWIR
jgi:hypothetical protein